MNRILEQIKPETITLIETQAAQSGLSIDEYLRRLLPISEQNSALKPDSKNDEFEADIKSFSEETENPPEHNGTYSREEIYAEDSIEKREARRQKSIAWIKSHVEEYGGKYVALDGDNLIAVGDRHGDALKAAIEAGYKKAFVGFIHPPNYVGYMGGWN
ncbi:MAG: hypothetical protein H7Z37_02835 [Pyrinomonadaceae bacterium]|nr:hypothetical protein [Pyrinomonadaceae bacterium]